MSKRSSAIDHIPSPAGHALGDQQMELGQHGQDATLDNVLSAAASYKLTGAACAADCS
ncbi:hypothetical protein ACFJGW_19820 [Burkholderiaceae bacterium UC74_6]